MQRTLVDTLRSAKRLPKLLNIFAVKLVAKGVTKPNGFTMEAMADYEAQEGTIGMPSRISSTNT